MTKYKPGDQVAYIPNHANGLNHKDVEFEFVTSVGDDGRLFCRYWWLGKPGILRTTSCSQLTYDSNLVLHKSVDQSVVVSLMKELGYSD